MPQPELSVVIPVRNGMPYLPEAVESVLGEDIADLEIVIRDNGSTDGTLAYARSIADPRVRVLEAEVPGSAGTNWTAVTSEARGRWVKLLCADDAVRPGGLRRQLAAAQANPDAVMVASRRDVVDDDGRLLMSGHGLGGLVGRRSGARAARRALLSGSNPFGEPSSALVRGDAFRESLPFTEEFPYLTDLDMYLRILEKGDFVGLATTDALFRLSTGSWSATVGNAQWREHRAWVAGLERDGRLKLGPVDRARVAAASLARFLARRATTWYFGRRSAG